jgi:site-specific DNA-methyltransferase (adenine-specific)
MVELLHIDCMDFMATVPDKYFDLAIVDPEYGIDVNMNMGLRKGQRKRYIQKAWDKMPADKIFFNELFRISKHQIIWGANHFISKIPFDSPCWIVWDKDNSGNFADCELAYTSFKTSVRKFTFRWNGMLQENMKDKETRIHPTQKPIQLYKWLLKNYAKPEYKIFDSHLGSGSSAIAAYDFGCDFVGCEIDKEYYDAAVKRFENHKLQQTIKF